MTEIALQVTVNGERRTVEVPANLLLADLLRDLFGLRGTKVACDQGACGACTVLVDGMPMTSCLTFAFAVDGKDIVTIEGVSKADEALDSVQQAFHDSGVPQCGFCTPGMVLTAAALLAQGGVPSREKIREHLSGNYCRCTGYHAIVDAVEAVARARAGGDA
jgi:carbon-monoxide dehydrogenase small subunit